MNRKIKILATLFFVFPSLVLAHHVVTHNDHFELPAHVMPIAKHCNAHLNTPIFDTSFLRNPKAIRNYILNNRAEKVEVFKCKTIDGYTIRCYYFDRGKKDLFVTAPGVLWASEQMLPFATMVDCDVAIFDFQGKGYLETKWYNPFTWKLNPAMARTHTINGGKIKMGQLEHNNYRAVVQTLKQRKHYRQVIGHGVCYSGVIAIKAQAIHKEETGQNLFDKLIVDSIWINFASIFEKTKRHLVGKKKWLLRFPWLTNFGVRLLEWLTWVNLRNCTFNTLDYLTKIDIPIFFFHGEKDPIAPINEFHKMFLHTRKTQQKLALISPYEHAKTHLKDKELTKLVYDLFMELPYNRCVQTLKNKDMLENYLIQRYQNQIGTR